MFIALDYIHSSHHHSSSYSFYLPTRNIYEQVWVSTLTHFENGNFDVELSVFSDENAHVYDFPRDTNCNKIYCNIEGIHWYGHNNKNVLVAVSDKMKNNGKQDFRCQDKDQSIHFFGLP
jgi:hypothetical protein